MREDWIQGMYVPRRTSDRYLKAEWIKVNSPEKLEFIIGFSKD